MSLQDVNVEGPISQIEQKKSGGKNFARNFVDMKENLGAVFVNFHGSDVVATMKYEGNQGPHAIEATFMK